MPPRGQGGCMDRPYNFFVILVGRSRCWPSWICGGCWSHHFLQVVVCSYAWPGLRDMPVHSHTQTPTNQSGNDDDWQWAEDFRDCSISFGCRNRACEREKHCAKCHAVNVECSADPPEQSRTVSNYTLQIFLLVGCGDIWFTVPIKIDNLWTASEIYGGFLK